MKLTKITFVSLVLVGLSSALTAQSGDEPVVGRWTFPMDQNYVFKANGTFSAPNISGTWERVRMDDKTSAIIYRLNFSGGKDHTETLTLARGDREGREYESGHVLRLNQQMRVKKLPDKAGDDFRG
jgi:hypothetical protein